MNDQTRKRPGVEGAVPSQAPAEANADQAFDLWLWRGLHRLYDDVAEQPIPAELLRMIEEDRKARKRGPS